MNKLPILVFCLLLLLASGTSCSEGLTENEKKIIEQYTLQEEHNPELYGKWKDNETFTNKGRLAYEIISFDEKGLNEQRMYVEDEPFNDWHLRYYYYTKEGKIFFYRPAEKGFMAMDGEIFIEYEYRLSEDGKSLTVTDNVRKEEKTYSKADSGI